MADLVALTMEGKFAGEGLQSIDEDDDMLSAMAQELVEKNGIGDSADAIWRALNTEQQKTFVSHRHVDKGDERRVLSTESVDNPADLIAEVANAEPLIVFGQNPESLRVGRRRPRTVAAEQGSVFSWN